MSFEVYNSKEMVEKQLANHHSDPLNITDLDGKCVVLRRRIGELWGARQDEDYKVVFVSDNLRDCRMWIENDILYLTTKWPDLVKYGPPTWSSDSHHMKTEMAFMGTPDFFVDYMASVPRQEFGNRAFLPSPPVVRTYISGQPMKTYSRDDHGKFWED